MDKDVESILFSEQDLADCVARLAQEINRDYAGKELLVVGVLQGSFVFLADLVRRLDLPVCVEFISVSSYGSGAVSSGQLQLRLDLSAEIAGRHVLLVEDILDSGNTLHRLLPMLSARNPASLAVCVLLDKPERREKEIVAAYTGFQIPDAFVVGYGLDYDQKYRNFPYLGILKPVVYSS